MTPFQLLQFFDKFGLAVFLFLFIDALLDLEKKQDWRTYVRLGIGIAGLIVDGYNVFFINGF